MSSETLSAEAAVESLVEALHEWLTQLVWYPGCEVTDISEADLGWLTCQIQGGTNQRCGWKRLFSVAVGDFVDVLYDPRTMSWEVFKPGGAVVWSDNIYNVDQDSIRFEYTNSSTGTLNYGEVVVFDSGADLAVDTTTTIGDNAVAGAVVVGGAVGSLVEVAQLGVVNVLVDGNVTRGQYLRTGSTRGQATPTSGLERGTFGIALTSNTGGADEMVSAFIAGHSWFTQNQQVVTVGPYGCDYTTLTAALASITDAAANKFYVVEMQAGNYTESANVTIPQYVHVRGQGESTVLSMGIFNLQMSADTSLSNIVISGSGAALGGVVFITGNNVTFWDVRITGVVGVALAIFDVSNFRGYHIVCEAASTGAWSFYFENSGGYLWDCWADDTTNFDYGLYILDGVGSSNVETRYCTFRARSAGEDVEVEASSTWSHIACNFDPDNCTLTGTEIPLIMGKANYDDVVTFEDGITFDGASAANIVTVPDNVAQALNSVDVGGLEYIRVVSTDADPFVLLFPAGGGKVAVGHASPDTVYDVNGAFTIRELSSDPANPDEGSAVLWMSDGTGTGDDGDVLMKITAGGITNTVTLVDFSSL